MSNKNTLKPQKLDTSPEKQSERGKKKSLIKALNTRKYCDDGCPIYPCSLMSLSLSSKQEGKKPLCMLKHMPVKLKQQFLNIYSGDQDDMTKEINNVLTDIAQDITFIVKEGNVGKSMRYKAKYLDSLLKVKNSMKEKPK